MAVLDQAVKMGLGNLGEAARDPNFAGLRDREDFRKLFIGSKK
jgi:hypothetical protein